MVSPATGPQDIEKKKPTPRFTPVPFTTVKVEGQSGSKPAPATPARQPQEVPIRTMKDDQEEARVSQKIPPAPRTTALPVPSPLSPSAPKTFPLPPKGQTDQNTAVTLPGTRRNKGVFRIMVGSALLIVVFGSLGAALWYLFWREGGLLFEEQDPTELAAFTEVVPQEALVAIRYNLPTQPGRVQVEQMWMQSLETQATVSSLLTGDPRSLLSQNVQELLYVVLPETSRPFLLVPDTEGIRTLLAEQSSAQVESYKGWLVVNSVNISPYTAALSRGALSTMANVLSETQLAQEGVQWLVSPQLFTMLDPAGVFSEAWLPLGAEPVHLSVRLDPQEHMFSFSNDLTLTATPEGTDSRKQLRSFIPGDVTFALIGTNFAIDLPIMATQDATVIDTTIVFQPGVEQLLAALDQPYVYYVRQGPDGLPDVGIIIKLPDSLRKQLAMGDPTLETALSILLPQIISTTLDRELVYSEASYKERPLKYVNLIKDTETLDYTVTDDYIFVASSKEGMLALIDTMLGDSEPMAGLAPWQPLLASENVTPGGEHVMLGSLQEPTMTKLFPTNKATVPFALSVTPFSAGHYLSGAVLAPQ